MSKLASKWIDAFRAGTHGAKGTFTTADIDRIVASYQPGGAHEAPICIGHPKSNAPAFGWVAKVRRLGDLLQFQSHQVNPQFEEMVEAGSFKKRSASFYTDDAGKITGLRHIAFLGAQPPEVKGLADIQFSSEDNETIEFEETDNMAEETNIVDRVLAKIEERFGKKPEPSVKQFSEDDVKTMVASAVTDAIKPFAEKQAAHELSFSEGRKAAETAATKTRAIEAINRVKAKGAWVPAFDKLGLPLVFDELAKTTETVEFGEGDAKKSATPLEAFVSFMENLGKIVPTGSVYTGQRSVAVIGSDLPANADPNSARLDALVKARMKEKGVSYTVAFDEVSKDHVELLAPGGASAGTV